MNNKALINSFVWPGLPFCARLTLNVKPFAAVFLSSGTEYDLQQRPHLTFASLMAVEPLSFSSSETNYKKNIEGAVYGLFRKIIRT